VKELVHTMRMVNPEDTEIYQMSEWWRKGTSVPIDNPNFLQILQFYLIECPVSIPSGKDSNGRNKRSHVSEQGRTFEEIGWIGKNLTALWNVMKKASIIQYKCVNTPVKSADIAGEVENIIHSSNQKDEHFELICFVENSEIGKIRSIFYAIRNALAHGSFSVNNNNGKPVYYFQSERNGEIRSQIRLKESTLLRWIELFNMPVSEVRALNQSQKGKKTSKKRNEVHIYE